MLDLWHMMLASVGIGGLAALWLVKAVLGVGALRVYRRWRLRRVARVGQLP